MKVFGVPPSPFTRKVVVVLEEKKLPYDYEPFGPFPKRPELLSMHPMGLIPILEDQGQFICDSSVICAYLERLHPEVPMYPSEPSAFARALFLEEYADTAVANAVAPIFRERFVKPNAFNETGDEAVVEQALAEGVAPVFDHLESLLGEGEGILGSFGIADAALGNVLTGLRLSHEEVDGSRWPKLARYHEGLLKRPSFQKALPQA